MKVDIIETVLIDRGERDRKDFGDMSYLMMDIEKHGLIQPLSVAKVGDVDEYKAGKGSKPYKLLAGGRRLTACVRIGINEVPVRVYEEELTPAMMKSIELAENLCRKDLTWPETLMMKKRINNLLKEIHGEQLAPGMEGHTDADTARLLGEDKSTLSKDLKLAELLEVMPALGEFKTKEEARKVLQTIGAEEVRKMKAAEIKKIRSTSPMDIIRKKIVESYRVGNAREIASLPDASAKLIDLDPPYAIELDKVSKVTGVQTGMVNYDEMDAKAYIAIMNFLLPHCFRILKPDGWLVLWFAPTLWWQFNVDAPRAVGFQLRPLPCIWTKETGQTNRPELYLASTYESFFLSNKPASRIIVGRQGRSNEFSFKPVAPQYKTSKGEKPIELMQEILSLFCEPGDEIVVPFLGSGNTLLAAWNLGLEGVGYDLSSENKDSFVLKVHDAEPGLYRSYKE